MDAIVVQVNGKIKKENSSEHHPLEINVMDFEPLIEESMLEDEHDLERHIPVNCRMKTLNLFLDGDYVSIQLNDNPDYTVKFGENIPCYMEKGLMKFLKANVDLFDVSPK